MILFVCMTQEKFDIHLLNPVNIYTAPATNKAIKYILAVILNVGNLAQNSFHN